MKFIVEREFGVLVGGTAVGPRGGDMLGLLSLAVHKWATIDELRSMIYAFLTFYSPSGEAIGAYGRGFSTVIDPTYRGFKALDAVGGGTL